MYKPRLTRGKRYALPHSRVLLHQPHGGGEGQAVDIEIQAKEITHWEAFITSTERRDASPKAW